MSGVQEQMTVSDLPALPLTAGTAQHGTVLTLPKAAERLGVSVATLRRWVKAGDLDGAHQRDGRYGVEWVIPLATIESRLVTNPQPTPAQPPANAAEVEALRSEVARLTLALVKAETLAMERASQLDALHATTRTLMLTTSATAEQPRRWWSRKAKG
jgi:hypothetical protein